MLDTLQHGMLQAGIIDFDKSLLIVLVIFLVFWFALNALVVAPMKDAAEKRFARMAGARKAAERMDLRAAEAHTLYDERLRMARAEALAIREELAAAAQAKANSMLAVVRAEANESLRAGREVLHASAASARADLSPKVDELAQLISDRMLGQGGGAA